MVLTGYASIDRDYGGLNADRYDRGNRVYCSGAYAMTQDLSLGWFWGEAVANDYVLANEHRFDIVVTINPTAALRRHRVFCDGRQGGASLTSAGRARGGRSRESEPER